MKSRSLLLAILTSVVVLGGVWVVAAWSPLAVVDDPLVRMPGTQPGEVSLESPDRCLNCHADYDQPVEPGFNWKGSMMSQSARDFLFWACMTVAGQDSIWAVGRPNATDICERCHFPKGWLEERSDPTNASAMTGADYDGVQCDFCHSIYDPFFETTHDGTREGNDWLNYWDETNTSSTPAQTAADATHQQDSNLAGTVARFNGNAFYSSNLPPAGYTENGAGQYYVGVEPNGQKRASFADAGAKHKMFYSRYHKSKYFCSTCHDVSNPALANLTFDGTPPGDGTTVLPTEENSAYAYFHVERTFSEFMLSAYASPGGSPGIGPYSPGLFQTSLSNNYIARCQDCHMQDVEGEGADMTSALLRTGNPATTESTEHPYSGQPLHDMTGGNVWVSYVLASAVSGSTNYDATNDTLLNQGAATLTLDLAQGLGIDPAALLDGVDRAAQQLQLAASIQNLSYNAQTGELSFRIQNQTGHKLISGFPEGRRMLVNIQFYSGSTLLYEVNPYDATAGTLKGLTYPYSSIPPLPEPLGDAAYVDELVYEMHPTSSLTGEDETFHFALATGRYKDNRIPPKGFQIADAASRLSEPVWHGVSAPDYFSADEYAGGYDDVTLSDYDISVAGATSVEVNLYYQTTSREYIEFLRDEISGTGNLTLSSPTPSGEANAYIIQTDPFFAQLKAWGNTIWQLWTHNMNVPGAAPFLMTQSVHQVPTAVNLASFSATADAGHVILTWETTSELDNLGFNVYRAESVNGLRTQLNTSLIPSQNPGSPTGVSYQFVDETAQDGVGYYYWLEAVDIHGASELYGPISATLSPLSRLLPARPRLIAEPPSLRTR